jgi:hypothetical protein
MVLLHGPLETGDTRGVCVSEGRFFAAAREGLFVAELVADPRPAVRRHPGAPGLRDARDVEVLRCDEELRIAVTSEAIDASLDGGIAVITEVGSPEPRLVQLALDGAGRLEVSCPQRHELHVVSSSGVVTLNLSYGAGPTISAPIPETEGATAVSSACGSGSPDWLLALATVDGLRVMLTYRSGPGRLAGVLDIHPVHDVLIAGGLAYAATETGLIVVLLGEEP